MADKFKLIAVGVVVIIFFAGGIIAGYYKWGVTRETPDYRDLLEDTAEYIGDLENRNHELTRELESLKGPVESAKEESVEGEADADPVVSKFQAKIADLKAENVICFRYIRGSIVNGCEIIKGINRGHT